MTRVDGTWRAKAVRRPRSCEQALDDARRAPLSALRKYPQGWLVGVVMFSLSATWTAIVTFLPTLLVEDRNIPLTVGGPLLGFLYYGLIPGALFGSYVNRKATNRRLLLTVPATLNVLLALGISLTQDVVPLAALIAGNGTGVGCRACPGDAAVRVRGHSSPRGGRDERAGRHAVRNRVRRGADDRGRGGAASQAPFRPDSWRCRWQAQSASPPD